MKIYFITKLHHSLKNIFLTIKMVFEKFLTQKTVSDSSDTQGGEYAELLTDFSKAIQ